jgi:signal peptidase I
MFRRRDSGDPDKPRVRRARPSLWHRLSENLVDVLLWTVGGIGLLSLMAAIVAHVWGLSIILFSTGSMTPTIPAGTAALVQRVAASQISVGDVVTVERVDALPVTHRVTSVRAGAASGDYIITMRGDANPADDATPYQVREVRRVLYSVPGVAVTISRLRDPRVIAGMTLVAGVLVTWAFWPRRDTRPTRVAEDPEGEPREGGEGALEGVGGVERAGERQATGAEGAGPGGPENAGLDVLFGHEDPDHPAH